jgi:hypothetical protein
MPRLVFHIVEKNKWSIFVQYYNGEFHICANRKFNQNIIFNLKICGEHTTYLFLHELLNFKRNKMNYSITLFYSDLSDNSSFSDFEKVASDRMKEVIGYDNIELFETDILKYLSFVSFVKVDVSHSTNLD